MKSLSTILVTLLATFALSATAAVPNMQAQRLTVGVNESGCSGKTHCLHTTMQLEGIVTGTMNHTVEFIEGGMSTNQGADVIYSKQYTTNLGTQRIHSQNQWVGANIGDYVRICSTNGSFTAAPIDTDYTIETDTLSVSVPYGYSVAADGARCKKVTKLIHAPSFVSKTFVGCTVPGYTQWSFTVNDYHVRTYWVDWYSLQQSPYPHWQFEQRTWGTPSTITGQTNTTPVGIYARTRDTNGTFDQFRYITNSVNHSCP